MKAVNLIIFINFILLFVDRIETKRERKKKDRHSEPEKDPEPDIYPNEEPPAYTGPIEMTGALPGDQPIPERFHGNTHVNRKHRKRRSKRQHRSIFKMIFDCLRLKPRTKSTSKAKKSAHPRPVKR